MGLQQFPLDRPPDGMVVEPDLPESDNTMTPSELSLYNATGGQYDENLPPVMDPQGNPIPLDEFYPPDDAMVDEPVPPEIRRAAAAMEPTGVHYNFEPFRQIAALAQAGRMAEAQAAYRALDEQSRYVYDNIRDKERVPASEAARLSDAFRKLRDAEAAKQSDPLRQAQLAERNAKIAERQAVQSDFKVRRDTTIKNIEDVLADQDYQSLVGPWDGSVGRVYDAAFNDKLQAKRAKLDRLINIDVLDMTKYLRPISQDELKYLRSLVPGQSQHWEVYKQYLEEKLGMLKAADKALVNPATNQALPSDEAQPQAPAARPAAAALPRETFYDEDGTPWVGEVLPDGSAREVFN